MKTQKTKKGFKEYTDGKFRKKITVSVALTEKEIEIYNKAIKQTYHKSLKDALKSGIHDKLLHLWEDFADNEENLK